MVEAKIIDNMIVCGKCGHKIASYKDGKIILLCKHKDGSGKPPKCNTPNRIKL